MTTSNTTAVQQGPTLGEAREAVAAIRNAARGMGEHYSTVARFLGSKGYSVRKGAEVLSYGKSHLARIVKGYTVAASLAGEEPGADIVGACVETAGTYSADALDAILTNARDRKRGTLVTRWDQAVKAYGPPVNRETRGERNAIDPDHTPTAFNVTANGGNVGNEHGGNGASEPQGGDAGPAMTPAQHIGAAIRGLESTKPTKRADVAALVALVDQLTDAAAEWSARV